ncbi:hypothetical protein [Kitasatospora sp. NPDC097643]|uniref:hypothetical protein n=1 Tax=Kitasatospora sp. NPDC097643 TaxID=3157230 RepID=UPI00332672C7
MAGGGSGTRGSAEGGEFVIKPWELHGEGREFERIGRELGKAVGALERGLGALGTPWGTDAPGSGFAAVYGHAHGELAAGLRGLAGRLGQVGTGLHTMAERVSDADTTAAAGFGPGGRVGADPAVASPAVAVGRPKAGTGNPAVAATPGPAPAVPKDMSA